MPRATFRVLLAGALSVSPAPGAAQQPSPEVAGLEALAAHPEQLADRQVRLKIFKALEAPSPDVVAAAIELVAGSQDLAGDPMLWRRFNAVLSAADPPRRKAILDRATAKGTVSDVRVLAVVVESLGADDGALRASARTLVRSQPALQEHPAVADALARAGEPMAAVVLPSFDAFKASVQPVLEVVGSDKKRCASCHEDHSVLRLSPIDAGLPADEQVRARYRAALRVVDLEAPERSLILRKPTSPKREAALTHGGGVRFDPDSASYRAVLAWIKTGRITR